MSARWQTRQLQALFLCRHIKNNQRLAKITLQKLCKAANDIQQPIEYSIQKSHTQNNRKFNGIFIYLALAPYLYNQEEVASSRFSPLECKEQSETCLLCYKLSLSCPMDWFLFSQICSSVRKEGITWISCWRRSQKAYESRRGTAGAQRGKLQLEEYKRASKALRRN